MFFFIVYQNNFVSIIKKYPYFLYFNKVFFKLIIY